MKIDCHVHVNWRGYRAADVAKHLDTVGIDKAWLLTWENVDGLTASYTHLSYDGVAGAVKQFPNRFIPFYAPDPRRPDAESCLLEAIKRGLKGFGECKVQVCLEDPGLLRLFQICGDYGLPVLIHMDKPLPPGYGQWYNMDIDALGRVCARFPAVNFVGHAPGFWRYVSGDEEEGPSPYPKGKVKPGGKLIKLLQKHKNLYCDLSAGSGLNALSRDPAWARQFLTRYCDRLLYGTDEYDHSLLDFLNGLRLGTVVMRKIMGENAGRLLPS